METVFVRALHDFVPVTSTTGGGAASCLSFRAGDVLRVLNRDGSGWWDGELDGRRGWFPSNYVEPIEDAPASDDGSEPDSGPVAAAFAPILQAVALLRDAVDAERSSHYQVTTAGVISSIRAVLAATDCLARESPVLRRHAVLVRERKQILSLLSTLVTQARRCTAAAASESPPSELDAPRRMLGMADDVVNGVRRFLDVAVQCGVEIPDRFEDAQTEQARRAKSTGDLRAARHAAQRRSLEPPVPSPVWNPSSSVSSSSSSDAGPTTPQSDAHGEDTAGPASTLENLSGLHDRLLSVIAALIGHVHAHTRTSHASSYAQLIDATREAIVCVQALLGAIESADPSVDPAREGLYVATTALVSAARVATSDQKPGADEEDERNQLLHSATAVLRASSDCVGAVRKASSRTRTASTAPTRPRAGRTHTLSMLGRKATSLSVLRDKYERDAQIVEENEGETDSNDASFESSRSEDLDEDELQRRRDQAPSPPEKSSIIARRGLHTPSPLVIASPASPPADSLTPSTAASRARMFDRDYAPQEIAFNGDGAVTGGTLKSLVERMTLHDTTTDAIFSTSFFMTFRMFTTPAALLDALVARFDIVPPADLAIDDAKLWHDRKAVPVRLRVFNVIKTWLELHWRPDADNVVLDALAAFARDRVAPSSLGVPAANRLVDLVNRRASGGLRSRAPMSRVGSGQDMAMPMTPLSGIGPLSPISIPSPIVSRSLMSGLRHGSAIAVTDVDTLELARQFTVMEARLFCAIAPDELLRQDFGKKQHAATSNVKAMSALSTRITGWIAETILDESDARKRTALLKYFIKLADVRSTDRRLGLTAQRLASLHNFNTLFAVLAALGSSTIARLRKTWDGLSNKHKLTIESLRRLTDHARNYSEYRATLRAAQPPCLPFLGIFLTDLTFCLEGNPSHRASPLDPSLRLINFDRYQVRSSPRFTALTPARRSYRASSTTCSGSRSPTRSPSRPSSSSGSARPSPACPAATSTASTAARS